ncbi:TetR/AcrR family transcriptional regulator [Rhodovastum atsumiense]|nr:TetR/AcrR family transcriptional regulator [Rhodovastum atsumiense]
MPQILEAALGEFTARGYAGASMAAVALRAGIAKGLIYHYFPSKAALFRATVQARIQPVLEEAERLVAEFRGPACDLLRLLLALAYARVAAAPQERALFRLIVTEAERFPELANLYQEDVLARAFRIVATVLRAGAESGEFRAEVGTTPGLAETVIAPVITASVWQMILGPAAPDVASLQAAQLDLLVHGLTKR